MNNAEIIKGIDLTIEGLKTIKNALSVKAESTDFPVEFAPETDTVAQGTFISASEDSLEIDVEKLKAMKYNEFKKLASSLGVKCTGTRDEILARILALDNAVIVSQPVPVEEDEDVEAETAVEEPEEEEAPVEKPVKSNIKKFEKRVEEPAKDEFDEQAEALAEETPIEDIIEALADVNIKANKKNAVSLLAVALREGLIEVEDEDEDTSEEEDLEEVEIEEEVEEEVSEYEDSDEEDGEFTADSYFPEFDPEGYNNPEDMTEERAKAVKDKMSEVLNAYFESELLDEDVTSYVEDNATDAEIELLGDDYTDEDVFKLFLELLKRTIDNNGVEHEPADPYEVADKDVCCAHELKYIKKTKKYVCEHCGTEYEAE